MPHISQGTIRLTVLERAYNYDIDGWVDMNKLVLVLVLVLVRELKDDTPRMLLSIQMNTALYREWC
jgi:hypothetical protein